MDEVFGGLWVLNEGVGAGGTLETEGLHLENPLMQRLPGHLPGLIPLAPCRFYPLAERLRTRLLSPLRGDQPATAGAVMDVEVLTLKGSLGSWCRRSPISLGTQRRWYGDVLQGLVTTRRTARDVDAGPLLHPLRHTLGLGLRRRLHLSQGLPA